MIFLIEKAFLLLFAGGVYKQFSSILGAYSQVEEIPYPNYPMFSLSVGFV